jgi:hypothetical protein
MSDDKHPPEHERRRFSRVVQAARTELHQGGAAWEVSLIDIGLNGLAVTQPGDWDADYSHPFNFIIHLDDGSRFEAYAHLVHIESGTLGFQMEHLAPDQVAPLARLLSQKIDDEVLQEELGQLEVD